MCRLQFPTPEMPLNFLEQAGQSVSDSDFLIGSRSLAESIMLYRQTNFYTPIFRMHYFG